MNQHHADFEFGENGCDEGTAPPRAVRRPLLAYAGRVELVNGPLLPEQDSLDTLSLYHFHLTRDRSMYG